MLYRFLSGSALKVIAVVSMTIDHIAYYILDQQMGQGVGNEGSHNVVFTLLLGLVVVFLIDHIHDALWLMLMETALFSAIATMLNTDYTWHGICLMVVFYLFRKHRGLTLLFGFPLLVEYGILGSAIGLAIPLMYSGRRGFVKGQWMKYLFYIYYPLHLSVIYLCSL